MTYLAIRIPSPECVRGEHPGHCWHLSGQQDPPWVDLQGGTPRCEFCCHCGTHRCAIVNETVSHGPYQDLIPESLVDLFRSAGSAAREGRAADAVRLYQTWSLRQLDTRESLSEAARLCAHTIDLAKTPVDTSLRGKVLAYVCRALQADPPRWILSDLEKAKSRLEEVER